MWPPNLFHPHGVSLLSLGTHWEFHWPSAFVDDHSDEVVAFEVHDSEFVAVELRRPLRPLEPRPLSSSGLRMKTGETPKNNSWGGPTISPPWFGNFEGKLTANSKNHIGGYILHTNPGSPTTQPFFYGLVSGTSIFLIVKFYHHPKRTT